MIDSDKGAIFKKLITDEKYRHKLYVDSVEHAKEMAVHLYGIKPKELLERVRPHEDPAITDYRLSSYEPTTTSTAEKALTIVNKIFHPGNFSILFEDDKNSQILKEYSEEYYPVFNSVVSYLSQYALKKVIADPNAMFVVQPYDFNVLITERVQPFVTAYPSCDIWQKTPDYLIIFIDKKEDTKEKWWLFQEVNKTQIINYKISTTNSQNYTIEELSQYTHNFGDIPAWTCGGVFDQDKPGLFESFFTPAVSFWNKAINAESDLDGAYVKHMNPQKWEVADECEYVHKADSGMSYPCNGGSIFVNDTGEKLKCPNCGGHGRKSLTGPYDVAWVNQNKFAGGDTSNIPIPPMGYVTVPTDATAMLEKRVDSFLQKGLNALNMDILDKIGENQSGVAKAIDRTELNDFLGKIRDRFFDIHLKNIYYYFSAYMFGFDGSDSSLYEPQIVKPQSFDVYNTVELTEQLKLAKDAGLSPIYLQSKQAEIQNKEFGQSPQFLTLINLTLELDPLSEETRDNITMMLADGTVLKTTVIIHDNIRQFVVRAMKENKNFGDLDYMEQMAILTKYAEEVEKATKVKLKPAVPLFDDPKSTV